MVFERLNAASGLLQADETVAIGVSLGRSLDRDIIEPEVEVTRQGLIDVPDSPGTGYRVREDFIERLTVRKEVFACR